MPGSGVLTRYECMRSRQPIFGLMYRLGFAPWDGHPLGEGLAKVVGELPAGRALEVGCGTGGGCIYLANAAGP